MMTRETYETRRLALLNEQPTEWDTSSNIAFRMFHVNKWDRIDALDNEWTAPERAARKARRCHTAKLVLLLVALLLGIEVGVIFGGLK